MRIVITGPRSVGKMTISKELSKNLKLKYISSDELGEKALKKESESMQELRQILPSLKKLNKQFGGMKK